MSRVTAPVPHAISTIVQGEAEVRFAKEASERLTYVHVVTSSVRKLYRCQVVIVRHSLDAPLSQGPLPGQ